MCPVNLPARSSAAALRPDGPDDVTEVTEEIRQTAPSGACGRSCLTDMFLQFQRYFHFGSLISLHSDAGELRVRNRCAEILSAEHFPERKIPYDDKNEASNKRPAAMEAFAYPGAKDTGAAVSHDDETGLSGGSVHGDSSVFQKNPRYGNGFRMADPEKS